MQQRVHALSDHAQRHVAPRGRIVGDAHPLFAWLVPQVASDTGRCAELELRRELSGARRLEHVGDHSRNGRALDRRRTGQPHLESRRFRLRAQPRRSRVAPARATSRRSSDAASSPRARASRSRADPCSTASRAAPFRRARPARRAAAARESSRAARRALCHSTLAVTPAVVWCGRGCLMEPLVSSYGEVDDCAIARGSGERSAAARARRRAPASSRSASRPR